MWALTPRTERGERKSSLACSKPLMSLLSRMWLRDSSCLGGSVATSSKSGRAKKPKTSRHSNTKGPQASKCSIDQKTLLADVGCKALLPNVKMDVAKLKEASKELSAVFAGDKLEEAELIAWNGGLPCQDCQHEVAEASLPGCTGKGENAPTPSFPGPFLKI